MLRTAGRGFGGGVTAIVMAIGSFKAATEFAQFMLAVGGFVVLGWTIKQLATSSTRNQAEAASAKAVQHLKEIEAAKVLAELCEECRIGQIPVQCPIPPDQRPQDCPRKDS